MITSFLALSTSAIGAQQAQRPGSADLPGLKWTVDEIKAAVAPARAGRDLTPKQWPNGAKVAVCLSFDVDNESPLLAAGRTAISPLSETEFGAKQGVPRILRMLDRESVPATFCFPAVSAILAPELGL